MDLLNDKVSKLYFKFLAAAFGSTLISSIYGFVDMIVVGQYHGGYLAYLEHNLQFRASLQDWQFGTLQLRKRKIR